MDTHISLRPDNDEDRAMLKEMGDTGIVVFGRGSYLSFSSKKYWNRETKPTNDLYVVDGKATTDRMVWENAVLESLHELHDQSIEIRGKYNGEPFDFMWSTEKRLENAIAIIKEYHKRNK